MIAFPRLVLPMLATCAGVLVLGGCGGDEPVEIEGRTLRLRLDEYRIMPQAVSAPAGRLRMIIRNLGLQPHNVAVETIPEIGSDDPAVEIARAATVHAGQRSEVTFVIAPGTYRLVCTIANHDDLGQTGTLVVE